jgi:hypothetical protein
VVVLGPRRTERVDPEVHLRRQDTAEFGYVHPRATVDLGREFLGHNVYSH